MATKGIKRIRIHSTGEEGVNNTRGLRDIKSLDISHPIGIKPSAQDQSIGVDTNEVIGGNETYTVFNVSQKNNEFLLSTEANDFLLYQNFYPDVYITASAEGPSEQFIKLLTTTDHATSRNTDIQNQFPLESRVTFNRNIYGNNAGWWESSQFKIKELPNTAFRVRGEIIFKGVDTDTTSTTYYLMLRDNGYIYAHSYGGVNGVPTGIKTRYAGFLPPKKMVVSASSVQYQTESFDFMVTQSHSRVFDVPLGPSYNPKRVYFLGTYGGTNNINVSQTAWTLNLAGDTEYGVSGFCRHLISQDSKLIIEPITIIDPTDKNYTEAPASEGTHPRQLSGSFVQPPTTQYLAQSFTGDYSTGEYEGGSVFQFNDFKYFTLWNETLPGFAPPNALYEQVSTGRLSVLEVTGSIRNTAWERFAGWRYTSVTTTSSLVPINNNNSNYDISDFNPTINNAVGERASEIYYDVDYTRGIVEPLNRRQIIGETATHASVEDSNYSRESWSNLRYNGSRVTSNNINEK